MSTKPNGKVKMDRIDLAILSILQREARITNQDLATRVNLSPSSCLNRVKRLEDQGYIGPFFGFVNLKAICRSVTCIATVTIQSQTQEDFLEFEEHIKDIPEIVECYTVSGAFDLFLKIICPDMDEYLNLINGLIDSIKPAVSINTHVVMTQNKQFSGYPLDKLL